MDVPVPRLIPCLHKLTVLNNMWVGGGGTYQAAAFHSDTYENLFTVVSGRKRFFLAAPQAADALQESTAIPVMAVSPLSATRLPSAVGDQVQLFEADLRAGDQLYLPAMWFHEVHSSHRNVAVATWFSYFEQPLLVGPGGVGRSQGAELDYFPGGSEATRLRALPANLSQTHSPRALASKATAPSPPLSPP